MTQDHDQSPAEHDGLMTPEVDRRLAEHGPNALPELPARSLIRRVGRQLQSPIIYILLLALAFDIGKWVYEGLSGWPIEGIAIAAVLLLNVAFGVFQEYRSEKALAHLKRLAAPQVWARRDGALQRVPSRQLVPGDVVRLEAGDRVPADAQLRRGQGILVDESVLSGESLAVDKQAGDELLSGTQVVRGKGDAVVLRTGAKSQMGRLALTLGEIETSKTPLERRLDRFGNQVARWTGLVAALIVVVGVALEGFSRADEWFLFAVALAVAVVPEGLPAVLTLNLALGVQRMTRRHAVVRRLSAVEALGSVTVIATDKTGTLTENHMAVHAVDARDIDAALRAMVLANDADVTATAGDPLDVSLVEYARARGVDVAALRREHPRRDERAFDSAWKFMRATVGPAGASYFKGAPEVLLARARLSPAEHAAWATRAEAAAARGYRVLALAEREDAREEELTFIGLVQLWDPPRPEVAAALASAQAAGIRVVVVTGDHPTTARAAAEAIGLPSSEVVVGAAVATMSPEELRRAVRSAGVFARVSPEHKLRIVEALKAEGEIVAVTGDGVNDAPALKRSDVGVAMGRRGSDVAREVADLVLTDDNFASIVAAVEEGRNIYENIQKFVRYTFSTNVALILLLIAGTAIAYGYGLRDAGGMLLLPLTATQLLWINFIGDGPPALALALDRNPGTMARPPRPAASGLLDRSSVWFIVVTGLLKGGLGAVLMIVYGAFGVGVALLQTGVFLYESVAKLVSAYPARRGPGGPPRPNLVLLASIALGLALQIATAYVPWLRRLLALERPRAGDIGLVLACVVVSWLVAAIANHVIHRATDPWHRTRASLRRRREAHKPSLGTPVAG
jgi:Ca2+-transporting ATPase